MSEPRLHLNEVEDAKASRKKRAAYYTPLDLVAEMVRLSDLYPSARCLEPSAGDGRIAAAMREAGVLRVDACEVDEGARAHIAAHGSAELVAADFLTYRPGPIYDRILMNPPFKGKQYLRHIEHAFSLLAPDGLLTAIAPPTMGPALSDGSVKLPGCGWATYEDLGEGWFKDFGAGISVLLVQAGREPRGTARELIYDFFPNLPTANTALCLENDGVDILGRVRKAASPEALKTLALPLLTHFGWWTPYGVDWEIVHRYLKAEEAEPELATREPEGPADLTTAQASLFEPIGHPDRPTEKPLQQAALFDFQPSSLAVGGEG